jgi:nitrate/nitrite-specific signal transduction histidine kinase
MRERAQSMGSRLKIQTDPAHGTTISVDVHIEAQDTLDEEHKADTYSGR